MEQYLALIPEFLICIAALLALFATLLGSDRAASVIGALFSFAAAVVVWMVPTPADAFFGLLDFTLGSAALILRSVIPALTGLFCCWTIARGWAGVRAREGVALALFSTLGSMLLVSANDLITLFISLELATMPVYVLIGYLHEDRRSLEGALKYFLLSVVTSMIMAYGFSFVYGINGTTLFQPLAVQGSSWTATLVGVLVLMGFLGKLGAVPFHYWVPDATAGAPTASAAFVSSIAKIAPMWALVRILAEIFPDVPGLHFAIMVAAVVSIALGTFVALPQSDLRRLLAYSGIANVGYALFAVGAGTAAGYASALFYMFAYAIGALGLFLVVAQEGATLQDVAGLIKRRAYAAWAAVGFIFSIIGFPPFAGFYGKLGALSAALHAGYTWAVVIAVLFSVVAGGYGFRIIRAMFTPGENAPEMVDRPSLEESTEYRQFPALAAAVILVTVALVLAAGLASEPILQLFEAALL